MVVPTQHRTILSNLDPWTRASSNVMARAARLQSPEMIPVIGAEPISLNVAYEVRAFLEREGVRSIILVSPGFRSRPICADLRQGLESGGHLHVVCARVRQKHAIQLDPHVARY